MNFCLEEAYKKGCKASGVDSQAIEDARKQGQDEVWELAKKLCFSAKSGGWTVEEMVEIFELSGVCEILKELTAQEAIKKVNDFERKKLEISVGDEIKDKVNSSIIETVVQVGRDFYYGITKDGNFSGITKSNAVKTGRHFDIQSILDDMKG